MLFIKTLLKILKIDLILLTRYTKVKNITIMVLKKDELDGKIMIKLVGFRAKFYSYLIDDGSKDQKGKGIRKCVIKIKIKFENWKNCLEAAQLGNKINFLENKINMHSFKI